MRKIVCRDCKYTISCDYDSVEVTENIVISEGGDLIVDRLAQQVEYSVCPSCGGYDTLEVR